MLSGSVGWMCIVFAMSSAVAPSSMARTSSWTISAPCSPTMCAPSNSSVSAFVTSLTNPSVSPSAFGLPWSAKSWRPTPTSYRFACFLFGQPDVADLRVGEHRPWDGSALGADFFAFREVPIQEICVVARAEWVNIGGPLTSPMA